MLPRVYRGWVSDLVKEVEMELDRYLSKLSLWRRFLLRVLGYTALGRVTIVTPTGSVSETVIYIARCPNCRKIFVDYPHSYDQYLICPRCGFRIYV